MKKKIFWLLLAHCIFYANSCAKLDKIYYFRTDSTNWKMRTKNLHIDSPVFNNSLERDEWKQISYIYVGEAGDSIIMYSPVSRFKFLWGPFVIPFIPLSPLAITSGENTLYKIAIKQNKDMPPDNITCIVDGKEVYPKIIYAGRKNHANQLYWIPCWTADSTYFSSYEPAANWANSKYCINETGFYMYTYYGINESAKKIAIYFKDNSAAPLFLKRKKGVQYVLEIIPVTTYY